MVEDVSLRQYVDQRLADYDRAVQAALASAEKAITKADIATEKRFESVNEFRATLADQQNTFLSRPEYDANHKNLSDRVSALETFRYESSGVLKGGSALIATMGLLISLAVLALQFWHSQIIYNPK